MTLNQVVNRLKALSLAHKQVRNFYQGLVTDFLTNKTTKYPSVFAQDNGGSISTKGHATTLNYRIFLVDLVNVSEETNANVQDVQSDMVSIAMDLIAEMNAGYFDDWAISSENPLQLVEQETDGDMYAGCYVDISIRIMFKQNLCQIPTDEIQGSPTDTDMKVYDAEYIATGTEGTIIVIPEAIGKRILLLIRENNSLHKVSNLPGSTEYVWDGNSVTLGTSVLAGERFLTLFRNY